MTCSNKRPRHYLRECADTAVRPWGIFVAQKANPDRTQCATFSWLSEIRKLHGMAQFFKTDSYLRIVMELVQSSGVVSIFNLP
jgi:hypothetical protein